MNSNFKHTIVWMPLKEGAFGNISQNTIKTPNIFCLIEELPFVLRETLLSVHSPSKWYSKNFRYLTREILTLRKAKWIDLDDGNMGIIVEIIFRDTIGKFSWNKIIFLAKKKFNVTLEGGVRHYELIICILRVC